MKTNIALIGFMGTGKSTVGRALAEKLGREFVEMDRVVEEMAGKRIPRIFSEDGEIAFRALEIEATARIAGGQRLVIACGGGVVVNRINIDRLRETSRIVHLTASPRAIVRRTSTEPNQRPLLDVADPAARIRELARFRKSLYDRAADITVNTSRLSVATAADRIIDRLGEDDGFA